MTFTEMQAQGIIPASPLTHMFWRERVTHTFQSYIDSEDDILCLQDYIEGLCIEVYKLGVSHG